MKTFVFSILLATFAPLSAQAWFTLGVDGSNGLSGQQGYSGTNGKNAVVRADGRPLTLNLDGADGGQGGHGQDGSDAWSCSMRRLPSHDLRGADGGLGGIGGRGGNGGNGGEVTVYYQDLSNLKSIFVSSVGGQYGRGGPAGRGGRPCYCERRRWTKEHCTTKTDADGNKYQDCHTKRYSCQPGRPGRDGRMGRNGFNGSQGSLTIVRSDELLEADKTNESGMLSSMVDKEIVLAKNVFATKSGATGLLSPGSRVSDTYREFVERKVVSAEVVWESDRDLTQLDRKVILLMRGTNTPDLSVPYDLWLGLTEEVDGNHKVITVKKAMTEAEAKAVKMSVEGTGASTVLRIKQLAPQPELIDTKVSIRIKRDKVFSNPTVLEKTVLDERFITLEGTDLIVALGQLPVSDRKTFRGGKKIKVFVDLERSFAGKVTQAGDLLKYKLPK